MIDRYTRFILTLIAVALLLIAVRGLFVPEASAGDHLCRVAGPIEVRVTQMPKWPVGTWSGRPILVKQVAH